MADPQKCEFCEKNFEPTYLQLWKLRKGQSAHIFCSRQCRVEFYKKTVTQPCALCKKPVSRPESEHRKSKSGNMFCGLNCAVIWGNYTSKKQITSSALERFIQSKIEEEFPDLEVKYNDNEAIGSEIDIYFPDYRIGIECHGPFHYKPIRGGVKRFLGTLANDIRKLEMAAEANVLLVIMDTNTRAGKKAEERYWPQIRNLINAILDK